MTDSRLTTIRRAASALALVAAFHALPASAQNPAPSAAAAAPMTCDSACHARMGHGTAAAGQAAPMSGAMAGGMMCPMMGGMQGMGGMHRMGGMRRMGMHGMAGTGQMGAMPRMGTMGGAADTTAVREMADHHAMMTRAVYEALMRRGFTATQALQIVSAQGMPGGR